MIARTSRALAAVTVALFGISVTGAAARAHYSGYLHTWILIQSLLLGVCIGAIGLVLRDSQMLIDQLATLDGSLGTGQARLWKDSDWSLVCLQRGTPTRCPVMRGGELV